MPGPPRPRTQVPPPPLPLMLLVLAACGGRTAPAPRAEDLSLEVVSAQPRGAPGRADHRAPWTHFPGSKASAARG